METGSKEVVIVLEDGPGGCEIQNKLTNFVDETYKTTPSVVFLCF